MTGPSQTAAPPLAPLHLVTPGLEPHAAPLRGAGLLGASELVLVDAVARRFGEARPAVLVGLALAVRAQHAGHVGVDLRRAPELLEEPDDAPLDAPLGALPSPWPPDLAAWEAEVLASPLVGLPGDRSRPFTRQLTPAGTLLMTRRMWREQERLAAALLGLTAGAAAPAIPDAAVEEGVRRLFGAREAGSQAAAAVRAAARHRLAVVTGGPGTGKTFSIKRLLALLLENAGDRPLRVELAAPTGKAAVRMTEALAEGLGDLDTTDAVRAALRTLPARTLHKLLRMRPDGSARYGAGAPLPADVVVVDEASMVDLLLMRRLVEAVGPGARLVLLGDRDQLASVEVGTVLADVVAGAFDEPAAQTGALVPHVVRFTESRRFRDAPTVAAIAAHIQSREPERLDAAVGLMTGALAVEDPDEKRVTHLGAPAGGRPSEALLDDLAAPYLRGYVARLCAVLGDPARLRERATHLVLLQALDDYRVLAVHRRGPLGVSGLERALGERVRATLADAWQRQRRSPLPTRAGHWLGEPILVTQNAYDVDLRNGDIGLVLPGADGLCAVFPVVDRERPDAPASVREVALTRLPPHGGALAMTVHKSQGSQFTHVALVLSPRSSPIQTRELVYTGITRTRSRLSWVGTAALLDEALRRPVARASGLGPLLAGH